MKKVNGIQFSCIGTLLLLVAVIPAIAQSREVRSIDSLVDRCLKSNFINGNILIVDNGKPYYKRTVK